MAKIGIIGHGFIGQVHREVIESGVQELEVGALVDRDASKLSSFDKYSTYSSLEDFFNDGKNQIDAVIMALPIEAHVDAVREITQRQVPMLMEKPLSYSVKEATQIVEDIRKYKSPVMIGLTGHFHPEFRAAYDSLQRGDIGEIVSMQERIHFGIPDVEMMGSLVNSESGGGGVGLENGIHTMERLYHFSGSPVISIEGLTKSHSHLDGKLEDYIAGVAVTESGFHIPFSLRWNLDKEEDYSTGTK